MSMELCTEAWINVDERGLLGQVASNGGFADLSAAVAAGKYPALQAFFKAGVTDQCEQAITELGCLADSASLDVAKTARGLAKLMTGQTLVLLTSGQS